MVTPEKMEVLVDSMAHGMEISMEGATAAEMGWTDGRTDGTDGRTDGNQQLCRRMRNVYSARIIYCGGYGAHTLHGVLHRGLHGVYTAGSMLHNPIPHEARSLVAVSKLCVDESVLDKSVRPLPGENQSINRGQTRGSPTAIFRASKCSKRTQIRISQIAVRLFPSVSELILCL